MDKHVKILLLHQIFVLFNVSLKTWDSKNLSFEVGNVKDDVVSLFMYSFPSKRRERMMMDS